MENRNGEIVYAFVFARGGSKGVVGKNLRTLAGKPLLAHSIDTARKCKSIKEVFVSTDDKKIAKVAEGLGVQVIDRPAELATDEAPEWLAWQHAVHWLENRGHKFDVFLSLPTTSPLRNTQDVENCLNALTENTDFVVTITKSTRSPWFNMVKKEGEMLSPLCNEKAYTRRQDTPASYDMTTVAYVSRPSCIKLSNSIFESRVKGVLIPQDRALDIDTECDLVIAEALINKRAFE